MLSLSELAAFRAVVETGGVAAAARRMGLSRAVVSKRVSDLEAQLKANLFVRSTTRMTPTEAADLLYPRAKALLAAAEDAVDALRTPQTGFAGSLRVALPVDAAEVFLWAPILDFAAKHPDLRLSLDHDDRLVDLTAGGHDIAVRIGRLPDSSLRARRLGDSPRILCAAPSYLDERGHPQAPEDLSAHNVIHYSNAPASQIWRFLPADGGAPVSVQVAPRITCNNGAMMRAAAEAGIGLTVLPKFLVDEALDAGRLIVADMPWEPEPDGVFAVMAQSSQASPKLRAFVEHLIAWMQR